MREEIKTHVLNAYKNMLLKQEEYLQAQTDFRQTLADVMYSYGVSKNELAELLNKKPFEIRNELTAYHKDLRENT